MEISDYKEAVKNLKLKYKEDTNEQEGNYITRDLFDYELEEMTKDR
jgi:hypothetical protein